MTLCRRVWRYQCQSCLPISSGNSKEKDSDFLEYYAVYSKITSTKSRSFCMTTFSASLTNLTALLPQSRDCSYDVSRQILAPPPLWLQKHTNTLIYAHTTSPTLPTSDMSLGSLTLPAPKAGDFVDLILLYRYKSSGRAACLRHQCIAVYTGIQVPKLRRRCMFLSSGWS
jgi:hypothetical protein